MTLPRGARARAALAALAPLAPLAALAGCGHPAARPAPPPAPAPFAIRELTVTGAPPIDRALYAELARDVDADPETVLVDTAPRGDGVLALTAGRLVELDAAGRSAAWPVDPDLEIASARYLADGSVLVLAATGGDERARFYRATRTGAPVPIGETGRRIAAVVLDPARARAAWARIDDATGDAELVVGDPARGGSVVARGPGWLPVDLAADGSVLALQVASDHAAALYRIAHGETVALTPPGANVVDARFGPDGEALAITDAGQRDGEPRLATLAWRGAGEVASEPEARAFALAPDGSARAFVAGNVYSALVVERADGTRRTYRVDGAIDHLAFTADGTQLVFDESTPFAARAVRRWDLARAAPPPREAPRARFAFAAAAISTADGTALTALVARPLALPDGAARKRPVVVELHGGPEDRWVAEHDAEVDALALRGFAVVRPNVRGSTGYGRAFAAADDGARRGAAIADVGAVLDWIATQPDLDRKRVVLAGSSYGGFLAFAAALAYPARVRGVIDRSGIADLAAFLATTRLDRRAERRAEYGDERDPAMRGVLDALSPIARARDLAVPLLLAHGRADPRVPYADAARLAQAVTAPHWFVTGEDEGHLFSRFDHRIALRALELEFLRQYAR